MFDEYDKPEIIDDINEEKSMLLHSLKNTYIKLFMVEHEKCNHFRNEMEIIIFKEMLNDLIEMRSFWNNTLLNVAGQYNNIITINITKGISMLPEMEPGDIEFIRYSKDNDINIGDNVIGYECSRKMTLLHKVIKIKDRKIITKGVNNEEKDLITTDTVFGKVILIVKRNTEFWKFLIKELKLKDDLVDCLKYSLDIIENKLDSISDIELKEKENIKNLLKDLEKDDNTQ